VAVGADANLLAKAASVLAEQTRDLITEVAAQRPG